MCEDVLESDPYEGCQKKNQFGKCALNFGKKPGKETPERGKIKNKDRVDQQAHSEGEIAVMGRYRGNPINQDGVECNTAEKSKKKRLFR